MAMSPTGVLERLPAPWAATPLPSDAPSPAVQEVGKKRTGAGIDVLACSIIVAFGVAEFFLYRRAPDYVGEDVAYVELAKSLLHHGTYAYNSVVEKTQPPGFSIFLAALGSVLGFSYGVLVRVMAILSTLAFLIGYRLIRRSQGPGIAALSCILLASAPSVFQVTTRSLFPSYPYFVASLLFLLLVPKLESTKTRKTKVELWVALAILLMASVIIMSAGVALAGALIAWVITSFLRRSTQAKTRLKLFVPIAALGIFVQVLWMQQKGNTADWDLPGYPGSYLAQLQLKSGNYPELGMATKGDLAKRVEDNLSARTAVLAEMLVRHWVNPSLSSFGTAVLIGLTFIGLASSIVTGEAEIAAWYFIGYECIYMLWPWTLEFRFYLPIAPLACLFVFKGASAFLNWCRKYPVTTGLLCLPVFALLTIHSAIRALPGDATSHLQRKASAVLWASATIMAAVMAWKKSVPALDRLLSRIDQAVHFRGSHNVTRIQALGAAVVAVLVVAGVSSELRMAKENLAFDAARLYSTPDIQAALWIQSHTDANVAVAARRVPLVYHYSQRRVFWFPPILRPQALMEGILANRIRYIMVIDRDFSYYRPPDEYCFKLVSEAYPAAFRLAAQEDQVRIYEVVPNAVMSGAPLSPLATSTP
jgi:hypothetical protein